MNAVVLEDAYYGSVPMLCLLVSVVVGSVILLTKYGIMQEDTVKDVDGKKYRLVTVPGDGNCGFQALAAGINSLREEELEGSEGGLSAKDVRGVLRKELEAETEFYQEKLEEFGLDANTLQRLLIDVSAGGFDGHWLGAHLGEMEVMMLARALGLRVDVFTNDNGREVVRCYQTHDYGKGSVGLLYTGSSENGHFDLLVEAN